MGASADDLESAPLPVALTLAQWSRVRIALGDRADHLRGLVPTCERGGEGLERLAREYDETAETITQGIIKAMREQRG